MYGSSTFSRAVNEMHENDMASCFKGGYVSDRTWELTFIYLKLIEAGSLSDTEETTMSEAA